MVALSLRSGRPTMVMQYESAVDAKSVLVRRRISVIAGAVADVKGLRLRARNADANVMKARAGHLLGGVIAEQILRSQILRDLREGLVEATGAGVKILAAGLLGERDEGVLTAGIAPSAGLNRHVDDAVDHHLAAQRLFERLGVGYGVGRIAAIRHQHQHLASLLGGQALGGEINGVVESGSV